MMKIPVAIAQLAVVFAVCFGAAASAKAHSGLLDGYGCHRGPDKITYHCHQGQFAGRTFKSKEDFLRELRGGKAEAFSPKANPPVPPEKRTEK